MKVQKVTPSILNNWLAGDRKKEETLNCGSLGGFHVRTSHASPDGEIASASFRIKYRVNGKSRVVTIGKVSEISIPKARKLAEQYKAQGKAGIDILANRKEAQETLKAKATENANRLPTMLAWFNNVHHDRLYENNKHARINYFKRWITLLGHKSLDQISIEDVATSIRAYGPNVKKESSDKKHMEYFKELAAAYALDNKCPNPLANSRWQAYVKLGRLSWCISEDADEGDSRTAIKQEDFTKIINSLESLCMKYPDKTGPLAILFMAYSGMRPSDISSLKWSHVRTEEPDFLHIKKVLQKTKSQKQIASYIPITRQALNILERAKHLSQGEYVFSETDKIKVTAGLSSVWWDKVKKDTGLPFVLYQLRHNMAHQILRAGGTIADVAATLGNTVEVCVRNYLNNDPRHAATVLSKLTF